jgi:hypothetical protein
MDRITKTESAATKKKMESKCEIALCPENTGGTREIQKLIRNRCY